MASRGIFFEAGAIKSARGEQITSKFAGDRIDAQRPRSNSLSGLSDAAPLVINSRPRPLSAASTIRPENRKDWQDMQAQMRTRPQSATAGGRSNGMLRSPSASSGLEEKHTMLKEMTTPKRAMGVRAGGVLGYKSGLTRSSSMAESRFPRFVSDIHTVIENIKALERIEQAKILADEEEQKRKCLVKSIEITKTKDLCVLKFPKHGGTRLMVKRWSKGFVIHPPRSTGPPLKPRIDTLDTSHLLSHKVAQAEMRAAEKAAEKAAEERNRSLAELVQEEMEAAADKGSLAEEPAQAVETAVMDEIARIDQDITVIGSD